jgi:hypothetical protein
MEARTQAALLRTVLISWREYVHSIRQASRWFMVRA